MKNCFKLHLNRSFTSSFRHCRGQRKIKYLKWEKKSIYLWFTILYIEYMCVKRIAWTAVFDLIRGFVKAIYGMRVRVCVSVITVSATLLTSKENRPHIVEIIWLCWIHTYCPPPLLYIEQNTLYNFFYKIPGFVLTKPSWDWDWVNYSRPGKVWWVTSPLGMGIMVNLFYSVLQPPERKIESEMNDPARLYPPPLFFT